MFDDYIPLYIICCSFLRHILGRSRFNRFNGYASNVGFLEQVNRRGKHVGSKLAQRDSINEIEESVMAFNTNYKDTCLFGVYASAKTDCPNDLAYAILYNTTKLAH